VKSPLKQQLTCCSSLEGNIAILVCYKNQQLSLHRNHTL